MRNTRILCMFMSFFLLLFIHFPAWTEEAHAAGIVVTFADPNLEACIRNKIGIPTGDLTDGDLLLVDSLLCEARNIQNLQGIQ